MITCTAIQWTEKTHPLSTNAFMALELVKFGLLRPKAAINFARDAKPEELVELDWLNYLAGIPDGEVPPKIWEDRTEDIIQLINDWLNEEP
jgi:hypothetical protein